jgi:hypothetical protein
MLDLDLKKRKLIDIGFKGLSIFGYWVSLDFRLGYWID